MAIDENQSKFRDAFLQANKPMLDSLESPSNKAGEIHMMAGENSKSWTYPVMAAAIRNGDSDGLEYAARHTALSLKYFGGMDHGIPNAYIQPQDFRAAFMHAVSPLIASCETRNAREEIVLIDDKVYKKHEIATALREGNPLAIKYALSVIENLYPPKPRP